MAVEQDSELKMGEYIDEATILKRNHSIVSIFLAMDHLCGI